MFNNDPACVRSASSLRLAKKRKFFTRSDTWRSCIERRVESQLWGVNEIKWLEVSDWFLQILHLHSLCGRLELISWCLERQGRNWPGPGSPAKYDICRTKSTRLRCGYLKSNVRLRLTESRKVCDIVWLVHTSWQNVFRSLKFSKLDKGMKELSRDANWRHCKIGLLGNAECTWFKSFVPYLVWPCMARYGMINSQNDNEIILWDSLWLWRL